MFRLRMYFNRYLVVIILAALGGLSCSDSSQERAGNALPSGYTDGGYIELEQTLRIGEQTGTIFGDVGDIVAHPDGRIFVSDPEAMHIRVFSPGGDSLSVFGRKGEGPGEFADLDGIFIQVDTLIAWDSRRNGFLHYGTEPPFEFIDLVTPQRSKGTFFPRLLQPISTGFVVSYSHPYRGNDDGLTIWPGHRIALLNREGKFVNDSLLTISGSQAVFKTIGDGRMVAPLPFGRGGRVAVDQFGSIYRGRTDSLRIEKFTARGRKVNEIHIPHEYVAVNENDIDSVRAQFDGEQQKLLQGINLPDTRPAFDELVTDDQGRLWIDVTDDPSNNTTPWKIVDFDEKTVGEAVLPENVSIETIRDGKVYGVHTDEYGVDEVVVYQIKSVPA